MIFVLARKHGEDQGDDTLYLPAHFRLHRENWHYEYIFGYFRHAQFPNIHPPQGMPAWTLACHWSEALHGARSETNSFEYLYKWVDFCQKLSSYVQCQMIATLSNTAQTKCWIKNIFEGSLALKKVTEAVLGAHNHNFDDLEHYSGNIERIFLLLLEGEI